MPIWFAMRVAVLIFLLAAVPATAQLPTSTPTPTATPLTIQIRANHARSTPWLRTQRTTAGPRAAADGGAVAGVVGPTLGPLAGPIVVGTTIALTGTGFTPGSVIVLFIAGPTGVAAHGPFTPLTQSATTLQWALPPSVPLGNGFGSVVVVNTDQGFAQSNAQSQYVFGDAADGIPTITGINGQPLRPLDQFTPLASVETVVTASSTVTISGTGFSNPIVNLFTATGAFALTPQPGGTATQITVITPASLPTGPGAFQVVNTPLVGNGISNAVAVLLGAPLDIASIMQAGDQATVSGTGFSSAAVVNLFNAQGQVVVNLGGVFPTNGKGRVPLTVTPTSLVFTVPAAAMTGVAYLQVINPPFVGFSSTGGDPQGGFTINKPVVAAGGFSLRFFGNGSGDIDRVKIPLGASAPGLPVDVGGSFTIELWVKIASGNQPGSCTASSSSGDGWINGNIVVDRDVFGPGDDGDYGISLYDAGGWKVAYGVARGGSGATICGNVALSASGWNHIAVTRNAASGQIRLFVNGVADGSAVGQTGDVGYNNGRPTSFPADPFLVIGAEKHDVALPFVGLVDELRVSSSIRYSGAFSVPTQPFATDINTVALYHFDEGNGNLISDSASAAGGPSHGERRFGGSPSGPHWATDTPFGFSTPTITLQALPFTVDDPTEIVNAGDNRLFIVSQTGSIFIWNGSALLPTPFLTIPAGIISTGGERGLLGLAFHPQYAANRFFFVKYTNAAGNTQVARYRTSANPDVADPTSATIFLTVTQPAGNHNGGHLAFGPDGYLYIGMGDGGGCCDNAGAGNNAQNDAILLGKMLRIDVDNPAPPRAYGIPSTNPFVGPGNPLDEIWAKGLRNPWKYTFDRLTQGLFIADVGQGAREEVSYQANGSAGGQNYGWRLAEGFLCGTCQNTSTCEITSSTCANPALTPPIVDYSHALGCSITGGYVYRGTKIPNLYGKYLFGDLCSGRIWWARDNLGTWTAIQFTPTAGSLYAFGEDIDGELYIGRGGGTDTVYRLAP